MQAVIFDLDGTIVFSHPTHFKAYEKLFGEFGITWTFEEFERVFAGTGAPKIIFDILTRSGVRDFDINALVAKKRDIFNQLMAGQRLAVVPGFFEFLGELKQRGIKKIIASGSTTSNIHAMLANIDVLEDFPQVVSTVDDVPIPKPAPDIFLAASAILGVEPRDCLVLEDTTHGVKAAKKAGMKCIAFTTTTDAEALRAAGADLVTADYRGIPLEYI
ncbi:HAD family phosphatase [Candidatus Peregrinibacteria bacterium]|nr:HAD family phosphatase [Candidatus Peregrinibacteria bacterium]